jgi:hypothetical protein
LNFILGIGQNNGDIDILGIFVGVSSDKGIGAADIQSGDSTELFGIVDAMLFQDFSGNGNRRVDGVADNGQNGVGTEFGATFHQGLDNSCVCVLLLLMRVRIRVNERKGIYISCSISKRECNGSRGIKFDQTSNVRHPDRTVNN